MTSTKPRYNLQHLSVHVINLDRDIDRWNTVSAELLSKGVRLPKIKRILAVNGKALTSDDLIANTTFVARHFCTRGTIGCYLSHRSFWEKMLECPEDYQIVLEDDVVVADDFLRKVAGILNELENCEETSGGNWDVIFLGALGCVHPEGKYGLNRIAAFMSGGGRKNRQVTEHCHVPRRALGAHAYVLSKRGAEKLLRYAWTASGHVDVVAWGVPQLNILSVHPMLAHQDMRSQSTIGAITRGVETRLPRIVVDEYTGIILEWVFNAPVVRLGPFLLTMGRSVSYIVGGYIFGILFHDKIPWFLKIHTFIFAILFVVTKATTLHFGKPPSL